VNDASNSEVRREVTTRQAGGEWACTHGRKEIWSRDDDVVGEEIWLNLWVWSEKDSYLKIGQSMVNLRKETALKSQPHRIAEPSSP